MQEGRVQHLRSVELRNGLRVFEAVSPGSRLLGLALIDTLPEGHALLLRGCSSIHTFGMRFALDVVFLDAGLDAVRLVHRLPPRRLVRCPGSHSVLEARAGEAERFLRAGLAPVLAPGAAHGGLRCTRSSKPRQ